MLVLGLAYKKNSGDARESPAVAVVERWSPAGAEVAAVDPHVVERHVPDGVAPSSSSTPHELEAADVVVVLTDHDAFDYDLVSRTARLRVRHAHRCQGESVEVL